MMLKPRLRLLTMDLALQVQIACISSRKVLNWGGVSEALVCDTIAARDLGE